jgi:hypothetical protein
MTISAPFFSLWCQQFAMAKRLSRQFASGSVTLRWDGPDTCFLPPAAAPRASAIHARSGFMRASTVQNLDAPFTWTWVLRRSLLRRYNSLSSHQANKRRNLLSSVLQSLRCFYDLVRRAYDLSCDSEQGRKAVRV